MTHDGQGVQRVFERSVFERSVTLAAGWCRKMESTERMKRGWKVCGGVVHIRKKDEEAAAIATARLGGLRSSVRFSHDRAKNAKG